MILQLCGAPGPCRAAEEFLQSLLGSISCHVLSLKHPGSAGFLLSPEGQHLLRGLEAQFQCVFGTEHLARAALHTDPEEVELQPIPPPLPHTSAPVPPSPSLGGPGGVCLAGADILPHQVDPRALGPPDDAGRDQENVSLGRAPGDPQHLLWSFLDLTLHAALHSHLPGDQMPSNPFLHLPLAP